MAGKCPSCKAPLAAVNVEQVKIQRKTGATANGVSYFCPKCQAILGVSIDPVALQAELVQLIEKRITSLR